MCGAPWRYARVGVYFDTDPGMNDASGFTVEGNVFHRYGDGSPVNVGQGVGVLNKGSNNTFRNNLFVRVDAPYVSGYLGTSSAAVQNQSWLCGAALPSGNVNQDPRFLDEAARNLANRADGTLVLANGAVIPFSSIGRTAR